MPTTGLVEQIEAAAAALVLADADDPRSVANLHTRFADLADPCSTGQPAVAAELVRQTIELIGDVIVDNVPDKTLALDVVGRAISALQKIVCDGCDPADVTLPPELELNSLSSQSNSPASTALDTGSESRSGPVDRDRFSGFLQRAQDVLVEMKSLLGAGTPGGADVRLRLGELFSLIEREAANVQAHGIAHVCREAGCYLESLDDPASDDNLHDVCRWLTELAEDVSAEKMMATPPEDMLARLGAPNSPGSQTAGDAASSKPDEPLAGSGPKFVILDADESLLNDFITEAREHLETADVQLLTIEDNPQDTESLNSVFRSFHTIKGVAGFLALEDIAALAHEAESLLDLARKKKLILAGRTIDATFDAVDMMKTLVETVAHSMSKGVPMEIPGALPVLITQIQSAASGEESPLPAAEMHASEFDEPKKIGEVLLDSAAAEPEAVYAALVEQKSQATQGQTPEKLGEIMVRQGGAGAKDVAQALRRQRTGSRVREMVKVDTERLDLLLDTIGELVTTEVMVTCDPEILARASTRVKKNLALLAKISRELQEIGMSMRMVSIRGTFQKMARLMRDLARKAGKEVELTTEGEDTELDRSLIDSINDPLIHMIRNAVDHGIESSAAERRAAGKAPRGRIHLRAFHEGGRIHIHLSDDGRGLNRDRIREKAIERGLIGAEDNPTDYDLYNLIFEAGFSTAEKVTEVSGRGVGMDVVKRNVEGLHGHVEITSEPGRGAAFKMDLPLTLAIIDGMMVRVGKERYILPVLTVAESILPTADMLSTVVGKGEMLALRGNLLPLYRLSRLFGVADAVQDATKGVIVVVESGAQRAGLLVDELLGQQQTVIKTLSSSLGKTTALSGATIMPDGKVGLILDVAGIVQLAHSQN